MILINISAKEQNSYLSDLNSVFQCINSACTDAFGVTERDVIITTQCVAGNLGNMLLLNAVLPKPCPGAEKQQFITFLSKNLGSQINVKPRELAVTISEPPKENLGGVWSLK